MNLVGVDVFETVAVAVWAMLPAYVPNNFAVLAGGGAPIDGGRTWNGKRLLGDGKTWRGTAAGILAGAVLALILNAIRPSAAAFLGVMLPDPFPAVVIFTLPAGAMLGDMAASFLKRRTGRERGAAFPGIDQLDFVVMSLLLTLLAAPTWTLKTFDPPVIVVVLVATPLLHIVTNVVAYAVGLKNEPW
ncbi:CDP-2,3-bis-(O-geranylgeranyl)-sn-glycerol synthase [Haladaptatus sp. CMAA 1911]|uniref:CDP-2,3-bis-(O-geranylgeranyl)-sn-glycerol synthase n=1 Tax=unclassified Haladaptatus TaxID=2622732 RepID=UPI0037545479